MSKKAMKLVLEGAANYIDALGGDSRKYRQALSNEALDKMAENARNLGLDYEPAQRTWVGLTDVEWMNIVNKDQAWFGQRPDEVAHEVAKLVEAKLKEKNT